MAEIDGIMALSSPAMKIHDEGRIRKAVIVDGVVTNVIICGPDFAPPNTILMDAGEAERGWLLSDGVLIPPPY